MTTNDKPLLSIVELQEQLAFFQQRCIMLRGGSMVDRGREEAKDRDASLL